MAELAEVVADFVADGDELDRMLDGLDPEQWREETPAPGWTVTHQVAHLTATFRLAAAAAGAPEEFRRLSAGASTDFDAAVAAALSPFLDWPPQALLDRWRAARAEAANALTAAPPERPVPWLVNPLPPAVLAAAGIMELFAHGQDIADAVGVRPERTDRIRHLVEFAVRTRDFGYLSRGLTPPPDEFRFELTAPSGAVWTYGPAAATDRISGPAVDFCLLATRRRHRDDLALSAFGSRADHWLTIAQAYRGSPGPGRRPGQFAASVG